MMTMGLLFLNSFWAALAALGFAILFNVPKNTLWGCALAGATGYFVRGLTMQFGGTIEISSLAAAAAVGFLGQLLARYLQVPATTFTISGIIPLVPGSLAFRALMDFIQGADSGVEMGTELLLAALVSSIKTALILGGLAFGIATPTLLLRRRKPVV